MRVILLQDVKKVGKKNQIVEVSDGFAINFLINKKLAVQESSKSKEILAKQQEDIRIKEEQSVMEAKDLACKLEKVTLEFTAKAKDGKMFGNISLKQVEEELSNKYGYVIDKRKFLEKGSLSTLGYHKLKIELYKGVFGTINVHISEEVK